MMREERMGGIGTGQGEGKKRGGGGDEWGGGGKRAERG